MRACHVVEAVGRDVIGLALSHKGIVLEQILPFGFVVRCLESEEAVCFTPVQHHQSIIYQTGFMIAHVGKLTLTHRRISKSRRVRCWRSARGPRR
jgi:hypothetical protein